MKLWPTALAGGRRGIGAGRWNVRGWFMPQRVALRIYWQVGAQQGDEGSPPLQWRWGARGLALQRGSSEPLPDERGGERARDRRAVGPVTADAGGRGGGQSAARGGTAVGGGKSAGRGVG